MVRVLKVEYVKKHSHIFVPSFFKNRLSKKEKNLQNDLRIISIKIILMKNSMKLSIVNYPDNARSGFS